MGLGNLDLASELGGDFFNPMQESAPSLPSLSDVGPSLSVPSLAPSPSVSGGIGGLNDLLSSSDLPTLRSSYQDYLQKALAVPNRPEPKASSLFIQGGLPMIAAALFGGREGIAAAADPVSKVYATELNRAANAAENERTQALRTAQLVENRIGDVEDTFEKAAALEQRREQFKESLEFRKDQQDALEAFRGESLGLRQDMMRDREDARNERLSRIERDELRDEADKMYRRVNTELRPTTELVRSIEEVKSSLNSANGISSGMIQTQLSKMSGELRPTEPDIKRIALTSFAGDVAKAKNWLSGKSDITLTGAQQQAVADIIGEKLAMVEDRVTNEVERFKRTAVNLAPRHYELNKSGDIDALIEDSVYSGMSPYRSKDRGTQNDMSKGNTARANAVLDKFK